jgi:hypothetical protein
MNKLDRTQSIIILGVIAKLTILVIANINGGFNGDEPMHIDSGNHLAWGYMSFQPMIGLFAWIQNQFNSHSIFIHHIFVHISAILIMVFSGLIVIKLGGKWMSVLFLQICLLAAPGFGVTQNSFMPVVFDQLFWVLNFYVLILFCVDNKNKDLIWLGILMGLAFMAKISILFFIAGIIFSALLVNRKLFLNKYSWVAILCYFLIILPNIIWQVKNDFPVIVHMTSLKTKMLDEYNMGKNSMLLFLSLNPLSLLVWGAGLFYAPFSSRFKNYRLATYAILFSFILFLIAKAQFYYIFPIMIISFTFGCIFLEQWLVSKKRLVQIYIALIIISGLLLLPLGNTVLPIDAYIKYGRFDKQNDALFFNKESMIGAKNEIKEKRIPLNFEEYYTTVDWKNLMEEITRIYSELPEKDKMNCKIWTLNYTQAGAVNFWRNKFRLPQAFTFQAAYYKWVPQLLNGQTIIAVGQSKRKEDYPRLMKFFSKYFETVIYKQSIFCPYAREKSDTYYQIFLCAGFRYNTAYLLIDRKSDI